MKFSRYLKDRWKTGVVLLFVMITIEIFGLAYSIGLGFSIYIAAGITSAFFLGNFLEYMAKKSYYDDLMGKLNNLKEKYLITEMLRPAEMIEEEMLSEIMREVDKAMLEKINEYKHIQEEYKDYIELWIHEIKLPIATSKMIIENNKNDVTKRMAEEINIIEDYTEQALFYARSSHANKDYCVSDCKLRDIVNAAVKKNRQVLINQKMKIRVENVDLTVHTDSKWLVFILNQIIQNSIKYRNQSDAEIIFRGEEKQNNVILWIQDNGIGIKQYEVSRVFDKGFTGSNGRIRKKSTGIGLYLCRKLCDKLGLGIELFSQENVGTEVRIIFPKNSFYLTKT